MGGLFDQLIRASIRQRTVVLLLGVVLLMAGLLAARSASLDVLPDFSPPRVVVHTEAPGLGTLDVESLVTAPIEQVLLATPQAEIVRSSSSPGLSVVTVTFADDTDIFRARQAVGERLEAARRTVETVAGPPTIAPISAPLGALLKTCVSVADDADASLLRDVRSALQWRVRPRLLAIDGVAQVTVHGGGVERIEVRPDPFRLASFGIDLGTLTTTLKVGHAAQGAFVEDASSRSDVVVDARLPGAGAIARLSELGLMSADGTAVAVADVAEVVVADAPPTGAAWCDGHRGVYLQINKLPWADTPSTTEAVERVLHDVAAELPAGASLQPPAFRQADFVRTSLVAVGRAMALGAVFVVIVLVALLRSIRLALVSLVAIPLSLAAAVIVLVAFDVSINGMTLGGLAIAVGEVVDDAIVDVENIWRRLRENAASSEPRPVLEVVREASLEIRGSVVHATVIVVVVLLPVLLLGGLAGRIFAPLAAAYMLAIVASLAVALTVTPALAAILLPRLAADPTSRPSVLARVLSRAYRRVLDRATRWPYLVLALSFGAALIAAAVLPSLGGRFLPEFHENTLIVRAQATPGTSLPEAQRLLARIDAAVRAAPVVRVAGRAGRAELDDDGAPVQGLEIDLALDPDREGEPEDAIVELARRIGSVPGIGFVIEGFLSERIHEVLTGETAPIVVAIRGPDRATLQRLAADVSATLRDANGIAAVRPDAGLDAPEIHVTPIEHRLQLAGLLPAEVGAMVGMTLRGQHVLSFLEPDGRPVDVVLAGAPQLRSRDALGQIVLTSPTLGPVTLDRFIEVDERFVPTLARREGGQPIVVLAASTHDMPLSDVADDVEHRLAAMAVPPGYELVVGGEAAARRDAAWQLLAIGSLVAAAVLAMLAIAFASLRDAAVVLLNIPFGLVGGVAAASLAPEGISVAGFVGFVTLFGIIARNGIMFVTHKQHLERTRPDLDPVDIVFLAAEERLLPIVMTAATAGLALLPLAASFELAGSELEAPMAIVVCGGLLSSTALNLVVLPTLYVHLALRARTRLRGRT